MPTIAEILIEKFTREKDEDRFQLFADRFAEVYLPEVFENINYFSGMNERHHSTTGHPDAWKRYRNGIACLEASTINSDLKSKVERDVTALSENLKKSNLHATFALIVLTALYDKKPTDSSELDANLRAFIQTSLGLKDNKIEIIFGYQLVSILEKPQYAPLLRRHYDIQNSYGPLHLITEDIRFKHPNYQFPEIEAFENSKVYISSDLSDKCVRILDEDSALLIKGLSGSGKTVFSFILAFHFKNRNYDCLYLDLREQNNFQLKDLIDFVQTNGHKRMFVLIDNAQLCPALIQDYHQIRSAQKINGFKTLFITPVFPKKTDSNSEPNFEDIFVKDGGKAIFFTPSKESVKSLVSYFDPQTSESTINDSELLDIFDRFGHDLYLLAFALKSFGGKKLLENKLTLESTDFADVIRQRFILPSISAEKGIENLAILASFSTLDLAAPRAAFIADNSFIPLFKAEVKIGHIRKTSTGSFIFIHSAIGFAVITEYCRHEKKNLLDVLQVNLSRAPALIREMADAVFEQERIPAGGLVRTLFARKEFLNNAFSEGAILSTRQISLIQRYYSGFTKLYDEIIRKDTKTFAKVLASSDLISLINFLFDSFRDNPDEFAKLIPELIINIDAILKQAGKTPPHTIKDVLDRLDRIASHKTVEISCADNVRKLRKLIVDEITKTEEHSRFFALCSRSRFSLGYLKGLLQYLATEKPQFHDSVLKFVLSSENTVRLVERGFGAPLEHFANFLIYVQNKVGFNVLSLLSELEKEARINVVTESFYNSPFDMTFPYIEFWRKTDNPSANKYADKLLNSIFSKSNRPKLFDKLKHSSLPHICTFFGKVSDIGIKDDLDLDSMAIADFASSILENSRKIPAPQFEAFAEKLKGYGSTAQRLASELLIRNSRNINKKSTQISYQSVGELVSHLTRLRDGAKGGQIAFRQDFSYLNNKGVFFRSVSYLLRRASQRPYSTSHRIGNCHLRQILKILSLYQGSDDKLLNPLIELINNSPESFLAEPIDHLNDFLQKIDSSGNALLVSSGVHIRSCLVSEKFLAKFVNHCLSAGVSYMSNFFWHNFKEHREFVLAIVHKIETDYFQELLKCCANSKPSELVAFLKFIDLRKKNEIWLSGSIILADLFGKYNEIFKSSILGAKPDQNDGFMNFLELRYPRFIDAFKALSIN